MAEPGLAAVFLATAAILGMLVRQADRLVTPLSDEPKPAEMLDAFELRLIEYFLLPLARRVAALDLLAQPREIARIRDAYNVNVRRLEAASAAAKRFDRGKLHLNWFLVGGSCTMAPLGGVSLVVDPLTYGLSLVVVLLCCFSGCIVGMGHAFFEIRYGRKEFRSMESILRTQLSTESLSTLRTREGGEIAYA